MKTALTAVSVELQSLLVTDPGPDLVALIEQIVTQLADGVAGSRRHRVELAELAHRVLSTHARACAETAPDPVRLADWLLDLHPSPANGITLCAGCFGELGVDVPTLVPRFRNRVHFVHLRNIRGAPADFMETFPDDGDIDLPGRARLGGG